MSEYNESSPEKIVILDKLKKLHFSEVNQQELIDMINSLSVTEGELVFSSSAICHNQGYGSGFIQVYVKRLETDNEFQFRLKENKRKATQKEQEEQLKYEYLKRKFNSE